MIDNYQFGSITIDGQIYDHDVIIRPDKIIKWWRKEGHYVDIQDLKDLPEDFEVLVFGTGASGCCKVPKKTIEYVKNMGVKVLIQMTGEATKTYNKFLNEGKAVVGAFHLTC